MPVGSHDWGLSGRVVNEMCLPLGRWKQMSIFVGWEDGDGLRFRIHRDSQVQILQKLKRNESASVYIVVKNVRTMLFWKKMHRGYSKKTDDMLNKALEIARNAHAGQVDKGGDTYIFHPVRVALHCRTETEKIVALLHDVVEDTDVTLDDLRKEGFDTEVLDALQCLTRIEGEDYMDFIQRVATNPLATQVKMHDLKDNMDVSRLGGKPHWKMDIYKKALAYLEGLCGRRRILYVDMDNVLVDFQSGIDVLSEELRREYEGRYDETPHIFSKMRPKEGAMEAMDALKEKYDIYILSTAPWNNPTAWADKLSWVKQYLGETCHKRLILSHHKDLNRGDYLIDDREKNGADRFGGELILFGSERFPDWDAVRAYLLSS